MTTYDTNDYINNVQKVYDKGTKEQIQKAITELKNTATMHSESIFKYWIVKLERLLNNFDYYCNNSNTFKSNHKVLTEETNTTNKEQFKLFMINQYSKRRFTEDQIRRTNIEHTKHPEVNILTQLAIVSVNDGTFTQEEIDSITAL